jgi:rod shape-determining protein MreC
MFLLKRIRYLLLLLFVIAVAAVFSLNGRVDAVTEAVGWFNEQVIGTARRATIPFGPYRAMKKEISRMEIDRARLRVRLARSQEQTRRLQFMLGLHETKIPFADTRSGVVAHVVARDPETWHMTVTIDRGLNDGVRKGYVAMTGSGLVGRVTDVASHSATVMLITGNGNATSAAVPSKSIYGIAFGDGTGLIEIRSLPSSVRLKHGDFVATSGYGGNYPAGLPIGRVSSFHINHEELSPRVKVKPAADMANLYYLLMVAP